MIAPIFLQIPEVQLIALAGYGEAASEGKEGIMAVLNVINNRAKASTSEFTDYSVSGRWRSVILKPNAFSAFNPSYSIEPRLEKYAQDFNSASRSDPVLAQAYQLAQMLVSGTLFDNTYGSVYYHTTDILPSWASSYERVGTIGNHVFYRNPSLTEKILSAGLIMNPLTYIVGLGLMFLIYNQFKRR